MVARAQHLEVQVRPGRSSARADHGDAIAGNDDLAGSHQQLRGVRVARRQAVAVIDLDHPAEVALEAGEGDDAAGRREDRRAGARREVEAGVEGVRVRERIDAVAERRRQLGARDRQARRQAHQGERLLGGGARDRRDLLLDPAELGVERAERRRLAPRGQERAAGGAGRLGVPACLAPDGARADAGASAFITPIRLLELRRLALEPEQARRDRADLLERERAARAARARRDRRRHRA